MVPNELFKTTVFLEHPNVYTIDFYQAIIKSAFSGQNSDLEKASEVSYRVSFKINKAKKPHDLRKSF